MRAGAGGKGRLKIGWLPAVLAAGLAPCAPALAGNHTGVSVESSVAAILALEGDREYGRYLASECFTCHQRSGHADGIPSIVSLTPDYFVRALVEYRTGKRANEVMRLRANNLGDEEMAALAVYVGSLEAE